MVTSGISQRISNENFTLIDCFLVVYTASQDIRLPLKIINNSVDKN